MSDTQNLLKTCRERGIKIATAESCTGGMISAALTDIAGSSDVFERGFITYSNEAKTGMLGVDAAMIARHGAVSEQVAKAMAIGALRHSHADIAVSVTGIAGPGGGSETKPVGTVWIGLCKRGQEATASHQLFHGDRATVRQQTVEAALEMLYESI